MAVRILAVNPGSTSTKVAVFDDEREIFSKNMRHEAKDLARFETIPDQLEYRRDMILEELAENGLALESIDVFVGRGGGMEPCIGGTYVVEGLLLEHARTCHAANHPSVLGAVLSHEFAGIFNKQAYVVDPPDVDELQSIARISGLRDVPRQSRFHALNQKETARRAAASLGRPYESLQLVVAHLGGGISVAAHKNGRVIDVNDIINGDGPMTPTRCGQIAVKGIVDLCFSGHFSETEIRAFITKNGGVANHLGTSNMQEVIERAENGDAQAELVLSALIYQVAKEIGAYATVLKGKVDAIVLTGGIIHSERVTRHLEDYCGYIAPVLSYPGEFEMEALAHGALRVARGQEEALIYIGAAS
jgi:butyrate kinase